MRPRLNCCDADSDMKSVSVLIFLYFTMFLFFLPSLIFFFLYLLLNHSWSEFSGLELPYQISANWISCRIRPYLEASDWFLCGFYQRRPTMIIATMSRGISRSLNLLLILFLVWESWSNTVHCITNFTRTRSHFTQTICRSY